MNKENGQGLVELAVILIIAFIILGGSMLVIASIDDNSNGIPDWQETPVYIDEN